MPITLAKPCRHADLSCQTLQPCRSLWPNPAAMPITPTHTSKAPPAPPPALQAKSLPPSVLSQDAMVFLNIPMDAETPSLRLLRPQALVQVCVWGEGGGGRCVLVCVCGASCYSHLMYNCHLSCYCPLNDCHRPLACYCRWTCYCPLNDCPLPCRRRRYGTCYCRWTCYCPLNYCHCPLHCRRRRYGTGPPPLPTAWTWPQHAGQTSRQGAAARVGGVRAGVQRQGRRRGAGRPKPIYEVSAVLLCMRASQPKLQG